MSHHHHHEHHDESKEGVQTSSLYRRLSISIWLNAIIVIAQIVGGLLSGSLALLSDSMHNLSDVAALAIALFASKLAARPSTVRYTYGLQRAEVLAALLNGATLLIVVTLIARESILRILHPQTVDAVMVTVIGTIGLIANAVAMLLLRTHSHDNLNMKSAFLHLLQDTVSSVIVIASALLINLPYGKYFDPIASLIVVVLVLFSGWKIVRDALHILMEGVPHEVDVQLMQTEIERDFPVQSFHHIHVWEIGSGGRMLTAHVKICNQPMSEVESTLIKLEHYLHDRWKIDHCTLMPELTGCSKQTLLH